MSEIIQTEPSHRHGGRFNRRQAVELLRSRIALLEGRDRLIMKMYYENGASATQIAELMRVSTSTVSRRIRTLSRRLVGHRFHNCAGNSHRLSPRELEIARDHFIRGMSLRAIAAERDCSFYQIREIIRRIKLVSDCGPNEASVRRIRQASAGRSENVA